MKKIIVALAVTISMAQTAQAGDREVFGAIVGAVVGYHLMKPAEPQVVYLPQQYHRHPQVVYTEPCKVYTTQDRFGHVRLTDCNGRPVGRHHHH